METINRIIDNIMFIIFFIIALTMTAIKPLVLLSYVKVGSFVASNILHNTELDDKIFKTGEDFFEPIDDIYQKFATIFSNTLCKLSDMFISTKGLERMVQDFYYLKASYGDRHGTLYEILYETAIKIFNKENI